MNDAQIDELLNALTPRYDDRRGDWDRVLKDGRRAPVRLALGAAAVTAVAALVLAWPFAPGDRATVLERALAAVGEGPVLHAVLRDDWGGTLVDLESGAREPVYGEQEVWYDSARGLVHSVTRLGGVVQDESVSTPKEPPAELETLGRRYGEALQSGSARVAGEGTVEGEPVAWITIRSELLPDVADGRNHEWAQQVAVSRRTFEPVALRETRDGTPGPGTGRRVLELELLPAGQGDFRARGANGLEEAGFKQGREPMELEQARVTLGRAPLWLGREYAQLPLARVFRETTSVGRRPLIRVTGPDARAAEACGRMRGDPAGRCLRALGRSPLVIRPDGVFTSGPVVWGEEQTAVVLFYGTLGDDPSTYRKDVVPLWDRPNVTITEAAQPSRFTPGAGAYVPPPGSVFVAAGGRRGLLQVDGLHVSIEAAGEDAILTAARALVPVPE